MSQQSQGPVTPEALNHQVAELLATFTHPTLKKDLGQLRALHHCTILDDVLHIELQMPFVWETGFEALKAEINEQLI